MNQLANRVFTRPQRSWPARLLGLAIRLRAEIAVAIVVLAAWIWLTDQMPVWVAAVVSGALLLVLGSVRLTRRYLVRRLLAVLTRHRLRAVFVQCQVMNWTGNVPILLWSRPTPVGERVWLLLRAGVDVVDIERNLPHVASGCHARAARVSAHRSVRSLAKVDVIRRDPLTATPAPTERREPLHVVRDLPMGA